MLTVVADIDQPRIRAYFDLDIVETSEGLATQADVAGESEVLEGFLRGARRTKSKSVWDLSTLSKMDSHSGWVHSIRCSCKKL